MKSRRLSSEETSLYASLDGLMTYEQQASMHKNTRTKKSGFDFYKKFPDHIGGSFNGLPYEIVKKIAPECPYLYSEFANGTRLCLWVDIYECMKKREKNPVMLESYRIMAEFQAWIHGTSLGKLRETVCEKMMKIYQPKQKKAPRKR